MERRIITGVFGGTEEKKKDTHTKELLNKTSSMVDEVIVNLRDIVDNQEVNEELRGILKSYTVNSMLISIALAIESQK